MPSVKEFRVDRSPGETDLGRGAFFFTDRYSVFDWGEMPDHLPGKGSSLCIMGAHHFELLEERGIPNHYLGVEYNGDLVTLDQINSPSDRMRIELTQVPNLPHGSGKYNYDSFFKQGGKNYLIPLEIIFRNYVPAGSSLRNRKTPVEVGLDYEEWPDNPVALNEPIVEFSTKYEEQDRYLSGEEADELAGQADLSVLRDRALAVNNLINDRAESAGFCHHDGKIECLYIEGTIKVADVVGTFDENRFMLSEYPISKEFLREYYRRVQPEWYDQVKSAKKRAQKENRADWKSLCESTPEPLPEDLVTAVSRLYRSGVNKYTGRDWFDVPDLDSVLNTLERLV